MLRKKTIEEFLEELSSEKPTPGGGSAAADAGAKAAALVAKVAKKSGEKEIAEKSGRFMKVLLDLIDKDAEAFEGVMRARQISKLGGKESKGRDIKEEALKKAAEIPLQTARYSYEVLKLAEILVEKTKPSLVSDVGVAAMLAEASIKSALLNVKINLASIKDEEFKKEIEKVTYKIADYSLKAEDIIRFVQKKI